jgi:hypothetical protein
MSGKLDREGFVLNWLIAGPKVDEFVADNPFDDQLLFEKHMRGLLRDAVDPVLPEEIVLGSRSALGFPWRYSGGGSRYVDVSFFYHLPRKVELYAYTELVSEEERTLAADIWTYAAIDVWINGEAACTVERPVYKPITRRQLSLPLKKGKNRVFVRLQNLGVRDTRSILALQLWKAGNMEVTLPGEAALLIDLDNYLRKISCDEDSLVLPPDAPGRISAAPLGELKAGSRVAVPAEISKLLVRGETGSNSLERTIEVIAHIRPSYDPPGLGEAESRKLVFTRIAQDQSAENRFIILNVLARYALGIQGPSDREHILRSCQYIKERIDCSDFIAAGIIRLVKNYRLDKDLLERIRETFCVYRFWMDESGSDGMCFWSENHALLFHSAQLLAGAMYPDEIFSRSGRTGREQAAIGERRCREWLMDIKEDLFEEFLSSGYMCVTVGALLNVVDYGPESLSSMAIEVMDMLLEHLAVHTFKGSVIGPQGRVYRDVIYPFLQGTQSLIHHIDGEVPYSENNWPVFFATSKYRIPERLKNITRSEISDRYSCGNGEIVIYKQKNFILTSLASPRQDNALKWRSIVFEADSETPAEQAAKGSPSEKNAVLRQEFPFKDSYRYTKSLNERFHGTTDFRPGVFGYQQHFWYAALSAECIAFSNLPGGDTDHSSMRPGYWYGNGIFPAVKQYRNMLGVVYAIPESYPIHFTHLFFPAPKYDEYLQNGNWLFARKKDAWLGIWCNAVLEWHDDMLSKCELRTYADKVAYICICSDLSRDGSFEAFIASCEKLLVRFDEGRMLLSCGDSFSIRYAVHADNTQYI